MDQIATPILDFLWACLNIILCVLSLKVFPLAWHIRSYYSYFFHYLIDKRPVPECTLSRLTLFQPTVWTSSTPLGEIDIMGHKSNSTYFTDCDAARNYHMCCLFRLGLRSRSKGGMSFINPGNRKGTRDEPFYPALGAVTCTFRKAIQPGQRYDIVTQTLSWDEKWVYLISYFVRRGAFTPVHFSDRPKRKPQNCVREDMELPYSQGKSQDSAVLAISVARIVFKKGRKTIPPAEFLRDCGYLPSADQSPPLQSKEESGSDCDGSKLMDAIEEHRRRGLQMAQSINGLDDGLSLFDVNGKSAYAKF
ncbi:thioesterase/thiol ester dehydrase-isomerase [Aspergillus terreus]|uniref:Thioesterase/thiol ester dehydrase-isomerase n=1 Tax=Aspergillus terreus TaxID=33178 RepID=A0A5M3YZM7_ASPTE|nr:hypothetical protein ATETN484_0006059900 [Aspergillus terreus]GFF20195.1 thioesterase/thiol ester dehydrase-isomerase [Aspergillus terreus]